MDPAARVLASAWFRAWKGWWWAAGLALALVLVLVLGTAAVLAGMERETQARVADFYTGDLRVTAGDRGAAPADAFGFAGAAEVEQAKAGLAEAAGAGARVEARLESTYILSRRSFAEAFLFESEQYSVALPGVAPDSDAYSVGVVAGLDLGQAATRARLEPYVVAGRLPQARAQADPAPTDTTPIPLLMSVGQFRSLLDPRERELFGDTPTEAQLASLRLEITAARVQGAGLEKDIIRYPAIVRGLFVSGVEALDRLTVVTTLEDAARLLGHAPGDGVANVLTVHGGDAAKARRAAAQEGWSSEGPGPFTQRYLGQLIAVLGALGLALSSLLLAFPFLMVWSGMSQQLERARRELAVCHAVGMGHRSVRAALLLLGARVAAIALVPAALALLALQATLPGLLQRQLDLPFPLSFHLPGWVVALTAANLAVAGAAAFWGALRRHRGTDVAATLRAA